MAPTQPVMTVSATKPAVDHGSARANDIKMTPTINLARRCPAFSGRQSVEPCMQQDMRSFTAHPAQQESCFTSLLKVCAASFKPSTIVR